MNLIPISRSHKCCKYSQWGRKSKPETQDRQCSEIVKRLAKRDDFDIANIPSEQTMPPDWDMKTHSESGSKLSTTSPCEVRMDETIRADEC